LRDGISFTKENKIIEKTRITSLLLLTSFPPPFSQEEKENERNMAAVCSPTLPSSISLLLLFCKM